jgi:hypothetical protein
MAIWLKDNKLLLNELNKITKQDRIEFFRNKENFVLFWYYHFAKNFITELAPFHFEWIKELIE